MRHASVQHIKDLFPETVFYHSPVTMPDISFIKEGSVILQEKFYREFKELKSCMKFLQAGARKQIAWDPSDVRAAIVTSGGLCPGVNVVIKTLWK